MAIYNEILVGRFARGIQKVFSMKGGVPTRQLSGEVMATYELEKGMSLENRYPHSWLSFAYSALIAAGGVGTFGAFRLRNPTGSNVLAVLEKAEMVNVAGADTPFITRGPTGTGDLTTNDSANVSIRDLRMGPVGSALIQSKGTPAAPVGVQWWNGGLTAAFAQVEAILYPNQEFVIGPSDIVTVWSNVANTGFRCTFMWRERALEESELK